MLSATLDVAQVVHQKESEIIMSIRKVRFKLDRVFEVRDCLLEVAAFVLERSKVEKGLCKVRLEV